MVLACFSLGALLRVYDFDSYPLWIDEYGTSWVVAADSLAGVWQRALEVQGQSPLYYMLVFGFVKILGPGSLALRLPSLLAGLGLLGAGYLTAVRLFADRRVALATLAALALDERLVMYSQSARPYSLALLCSCLSFYFYGRMLHDARQRIRLAWLLASAASYYLHYLFGIALLAQFIHIILRSLRSGRKVLADVSAFVLLVILMLPGATQLADMYARRGMLDWVKHSEETWASLRLGLSVLGNPLLGLMAAGVLVVLVVERKKRLHISASALTLVVLWLAVPVVTVAVASISPEINLMNLRYVTVAIPAVALLYGSAVGIPRSRLLAVGLLVLILSVGVVRGVVPMLEGKGVFEARVRWNWIREQQWEKASHRLVEQSSKGDLVLYGTGFVELDSVILGKASTWVEDFTSWPVRAHLPAESSLRLRPLPFSYTPETRRALSRAIEEGGTPFWVVAFEGGVQSMLPIARRRLGFRVQRRQRYGKVYLLQLSREPVLP
jgi:hypothetical protein